MAYKKYIKKNGKIYGPYIYHSKRVDGRVVSEYHGSRENVLGKLNKVNKRNLIFVFATVALVLFFTLFFSLKTPNISGNVVLNLESQYQEDQPLEGVLSLSLKEGEMLPESSKIIFENAGEVYEYNLSSLVSEQTIEGEFFVEGQADLGQGVGYGLIGKKLSYPEVYFKLEVTGSGLEDNLTEENVSEEIVEEEVVEEPEEVSSPLTGSAVQGVFGAISNVFLNLGPTGKIISEDNQIQTSVTYWQEFRYALEQGQEATLIPGSVKTETKDLSEDRVQILLQDNEIIVTTDYYEEEVGFGKEYLGEEVNKLNIDISALNLSFKDPALKVKLLYEEKELKSYEVDLGESFTNVSEETEELEEDQFVLTNQEKNALSNEFGEESVKQTARAYKDWIIVEFKLGEYEVEYSYNKDLSKEDLDFLIKKDKFNWLKDISKELTTEETPSFRLDEFNKDYEIS